MPPFFSGHIQIDYVFLSFDILGLFKLSRSTRATLLVVGLPVPSLSFPVAKTNFTHLIHSCLITYWFSCLFEV